MAEENIKDFVVNWVVLGLLVVSLMSFTISFMYNNNPLGLGDNADSILNQTTSSVSTKLYQSQQDADVVLNITASTNPEASDLGSRDSVAASYSAGGTGKSFFESIKVFLAWVLVGDIGKMLIAVFGGIIGFSVFYYIYKLIRNGI
jgi:hypothetical protein